ncbi:MAG: T9SS type A sorting domain-containing protein [Mucilaginibacter sp.]
MEQNFTHSFSWRILITLVVFMNLAFAGDTHAQKSDTTISHATRSKLTASKSPYVKNSLHLALPPLKPAATSNLKVNVFRIDDKLLYDVTVYPNPITDQINIKYGLSRNAIVTVKIMDVLGNELMTLVSQRISSGEQSFSYPVNNKLSRGFYFIRIIAGTESVIKRISVL